MKTLELAVGDVLRGDELAEWEVLDPYFLREAAEVLVLKRAPRAKIGRGGADGVEAQFVLSKSPMNIFNSWESDVGVVVRVPERDVKMALAVVCRGTYDYELRGRREVVLRK